MFRRLTIRNFRSIEDATVELGKFTVVVGPNGSGKSNFVDALVFLRDLAKDAEQAVAQRGGFGSVLRRGKLRDLRFDLLLATNENTADEDHLRYRMVAWRSAGQDWSFSEELIAASAKSKSLFDVERLPLGGTARSQKRRFDFELDPRASALTLARQHSLIPAKYRSPLLDVRRYRLDPEAMRLPKPHTEDTILHENGDNLATVVGQLRAAGELGSTIDVMRRVIPGLVDVRSIDAGGHDVLEFEQKLGSGVHRFPARAMSEGSLRALGVVIAAQQVRKGQLLVIEEPEANVHPGAAALVYDVLQEASRRGDVLITTHSPDLLDAAKDETILVCNLVDGVTRIGPLASGQRQLVREGLFRLAELMRAEPLRIEGDEPETVDP